MGISASNRLMPHNTHGPDGKQTVRKATLTDLVVGLICADRDGNRIRIDRVDPAGDKLSYHFLNDELRVQEGIQESSIEKFLSEGWYAAAGSMTL
jgi:hypothetical protein